MIKMKKFLDGKFTVNCKTEDEAEQLLMMLDRTGFDWKSASVLLYIKFWGNHKEKTCYGMEMNGHKLVFGGKDFMIEEESRVVSFSKFIKPKKTNIEKVAKMLGVEIGEEFNICINNIASCYNPYYIGEKGLTVAKRDLKAHDGKLEALLLGKHTIQKLPPKPWKPKMGETYIFVASDGTKIPKVWKSQMEDYMLFNDKNYFKEYNEITPEIIERILKEMKGKYETI
ncbi:MAG: hypothetical protein JJE18_01630 [Eubacteriaceae bacterium]|nr:hypothetical protein [Eubacteriaceae bacterium]